MLFTEAVALLAQEKVKGSIKNKIQKAAIDAAVGEFKKEIQLSITRRIKNKIKSKIEDILVLLRVRAKSKVDDLRVRNILRFIALSQESSDLLEEVNDPYTALLMAVVPQQLIASNEEAVDNTFYITYDTETGTYNFPTGWEPTGDGGFADWKKKFVAATTNEITDDFAIRRIEEDPFLGKLSKGIVILQEVLKSSAVYPIDDKVVNFKSKEQAEVLIKEVKLDGDGASPKPYSNWGDQSTDDSFARFFFHGIGAALLEQQTAKSSRPDLGPIEISMPLEKLAVRDGFRPYGALVYFDTNQKVTGIYDCHYEKLVKPGDADWESTKFLAKSTALTLLTAREHLLQSHLTVSNTLCLASIKRLQPSHPIRRLVNIFTFRTNLVNDNAFLSLVPERSMLHRCTAFTYDSIVEIFSNGIENCNMYEPFPKRNMIPELITLSDEGKLPYHQEGCEYYAIVEVFVRDWLKKAGPQAVDADARAFYDEIQESSIGEKYELPKYSGEDDMVNVLTQCIFTVTCYHEIIGTIIDYTGDPYAMSTRVVDGATQADVQAFMIFLLVTASTALKVPMLMAPYADYFGVDGAPKWEKREWREFQKKLEAQSKKVLKKQKERDFEFLFFDPARFESAISV